MGGPCYLVTEDPKTGQEHRVRGPKCTDNFQVIPFQFQGKEWQSVEACFQGQKFQDLGIQDRIRLIMKTSPDESDKEHGMRVWSEGRRYSSIREDWDKVKVDIMFAVCMAKLESNPALQQELLATEPSKIEGGSSTAWKHPKLGHQNWDFWNGLIQMKCREMCKPAEKRNNGFLAEAEEIFKKYRDGY